MTTPKIALLPDRGVVSITGDDAAKLLQGVITNDMSAFETGAVAIHAGLLSAQGKIQHEFFVVKAGGGFLLETARERAGDLTKRLMLYKLRAKAEIKDVSSAHTVAVVWGGNNAGTRAWQAPAAPAESHRNVLWFRDPRNPDLGLRLILTTATDWVVGQAGDAAPSDAYHAHRIALGVPEGGRDYALGDAFPHEADFDLYHGVSFTKGCFVGQEVVARMEHKSVVRKRVVRLHGAGLAPGAEVKLGEVVIGTVGSVAGADGLALLRLDRVAEALDAGQTLTAGSQPVAVDADALTRYRVSVASKPTATF
ncbi:MAG: folate-binding protein [Hyphomicrobium sp.]